MASSRIVELAHSIQTNTSKIDQYFSSHGIPTPSFDIETPLRLDLPNDIAGYRMAIIEDTDELHSLIQGPTNQVNYLREISSPVLQAIYRFRLAYTFPVGESATYAQIAQKSGRGEAEVRRILRAAMTYHLFKESEPGVVTHTAATKALVQVPRLVDWVGMWLEEIVIGLARVVDVLTKWPGSHEPTQSPFSLAHGVQDSAYEEMSKYPERAERFKGAMEYFQNIPGFNATTVVDSFDWSVLKDGTVVDVGGSHGVVCIELARKFPSLRFVVQDRAEVIAGCQSKLPNDVAERVKFMEHDFFKEQSEKNADAYFFRWIFHNWSDEYCVKILNALKPALKPGARILVQDILLPEPGTISCYLERKMRATDIGMLALANAKERDRSDWDKLLKEAGPGFTFKSVKTPPGSELTLIEIVWEGS